MDKVFVSMRDEICRFVLYNDINASYKHLLILEEI